MQSSLASYEASSVKQAKLAMFQLIMLMIGCSLFVDAINGFFLAGMGIDLKLSALYKLLLILIVLYQIGSFSTRALAMIFSTLMVMLIGPIFTFVETTNHVGFVDDFTSCLKIISAPVIFVYLTFVALKWPEKLRLYGRRCFKVSFVVLLGNLLLGLLGYGFSSYGDSNVEGAEAGDDSIGIKGFFYAGNEVSGIFIILFAWALHRAWNKGVITYSFIAAIAMASGVLIATKAAMLASVILVFLIPIFNERNRLFNLTWLKVRIVLPVLIFGIVLAVTLIPIFESTGLLGRFMWFYEKKGIIGIILSGRDEFILTAIELFQHYGHWSDYLFGFSKTGLGVFTKNSMEIDPIDLYFWHGLAGLVFFLLVSVVFLRLSYFACHLKNSFWGPAALIINLSLIAVSFIAGHIFTSGMLAPLFGLVNGLAYLDYIKRKQLFGIDNKSVDKEVTRGLQNE